MYQMLVSLKGREGYVSLHDRVMKYSFPNQTCSQEIISSGMCAQMMLFMMFLRKV